MTITGTSFSVPFDQWAAGSKVLITVTMAPKEPFDEDMSIVFTCSSAEILRSFSDAEGGTYTVVLSYLPVMRLSAPSGLSVNKKNILRWEGVPCADRYMLRFYRNDGIAKIRIRHSTEFDVSDFLADGCTEVAITALGPPDDPSIRDSAPAKLELPPIQ